MQRLARDFKFRATLSVRLDRQEEQWHSEQPEAPAAVIEHEPIDEEQQTAGSRLLGGPMRIRSPWR